MADGRWGVFPLDINPLILSTPSVYRSPLLAISLPRQRQGVLLVMPRLTYSAILAAAMLTTTVISVPVEQHRSPSKHNLLGFDADYVHISSANDVAPKIVTHHAQTLHASVNPSHNLTAPSSRGSMHHKRTNGPDDRYEFTSQTAYPWRIVGKIQWSNGVFCSGSLIGPRHVLTAHHCVPTDGSSVTFSPGFDNGPGPAGSARVTAAVTTEGCGDGDCVSTIQLLQGISLVD